MPVCSSEMEARVMEVVGGGRRYRGAIRANNAFDCQAVISDYVSDRSGPFVSIYADDNATDICRSMGTISIQAARNIFWRRFKFFTNS
jgi:hypothetical protein